MYGGISTNPHASMCVACRITGAEEKGSSQEFQNNPFTSEECFETTKIKTFGSRFLFFPTAATTIVNHEQDLEWLALFISIRLHAASLFLLQEPQVIQGKRQPFPPGFHYIG